MQDQWKGLYESDQGLSDPTEKRESYVCSIIIRSVHGKMLKFNRM